MCVCVCELTSEVKGVVAYALLAWGEGVFEGESRARNVFTCLMFTTMCVYGFFSYVRRREKKGTLI